jgi:hypothetical protein
MQPVMRVTIQVSVREANGIPVRGGAIVNLTAEFGSLRLTAATQDASTATFADVAGGDYQIDVSAPGYKSATEHATVVGGGAFFTVYVYLQPEGEVSSGSPYPGAPVMSPKLQSEIGKGLDKLRHRQFDAARSRLRSPAFPRSPAHRLWPGEVQPRQHHPVVALVRRDVPGVAR